MLLPKTSPFPQMENGWPDVAASSYRYGTLPRSVQGVGKYDAGITSLRG